jgi:CheY-like chemotaxis protein
MGGGRPGRSPATFMQVSLPKDQATEQKPARKAGKPLRKRILLADDQQSVREAISLLLSLEEHEVTEAADGAEALELFMRGQFDLVITDFEMPNMKGDELAVRIKRVSPSQPILMITAYPEQLGDAHNPVDAMLNKPFQLQDLRQIMAKLLS